MNLRQLHHSIGNAQRAIDALLLPPSRADHGLSEAAPITALSHELVCDISHMHGHARQAEAQVESRRRIRLLSLAYTRLHSLQARLPTAETLSAAAYARALALGLSVEAAEADKRAAYHAARRAA